jgi:hypothetical protein
MTAQQTNETNYDLDEISKSLKIAPSRVRLIISTLVEKFNLDATKTPTNGLVAMLSAIVGIQETHTLSVTQAVEKYVTDLQQNQKQSTGKSKHAAGTMAESVDNLATNLAKQMAPKVVELTVKKLEDEVIKELSKGFEMFTINDCFNQLGIIIDAEIREVEKTDNFQISGGENILGYFALPEGK